MEEEEEESDHGCENANSPTLVAAHIRERSEELEMTPPLSAPQQTQEHRDATPPLANDEETTFELDMSNYVVLHTYCP